jgi:tRNA 2-thiouridine synthesizing protein B
MLHLIFQSPLQTATLQRIGKGDAVLFLENALFYLLKNAALNADLQTLSGRTQLFVLDSDLETRGIAAEELSSGINVINYAGWVSLTTEHKTIQSWF